MLRVFAPAPLSTLRLLLVLVFGLAVEAPSSARAADVYYQSFLVGERAAGMGGAFTALGDEATGAWYNPAGIVDVGGASIGLTVSAYQLDVRRLSSQFSLGDKTADLATRDFASFPSSFGYVRSFGTTLPQALAVTIVVPDYESYAGSVSIVGATSDAGGGVVRNVDLAASFRRSDRTIWFGLGYALRPHKRIALGANVAYALRHFQLGVSGHVQGTRMDELLVGETGAARAELLHGSLSMDFGLKLTLADNFFFGVAVRTPNLRTNRSGSVLFGDATGQLAQWSGADIEVESNEPLRVSVGLAYAKPRSFTLAADVRIHAPVSPYEPVLRRQADGTIIPDPIAGATLARTTVVNISVGGEYYLSERFLLRGGFFTNFTSRPDLRLEEGSSGLERAHGYGIAAAFAWLTEKTRLSLTVNYMLALGDVVGEAGRVGDEANYVLGPASRHVLSFLLAGAYRL